MPRISIYRVHFTATDRVLRPELGLPRTVAAMGETDLCGGNVFAEFRQQPLVLGNDLRPQ